MVSTLEQQRQANMARNAELLRQLEINNMGSSMQNDIRRKKETKAREKRKHPQVKKEIPTTHMPLRKSRRIAGEKVGDDFDDKDAIAKQIEEDNKRVEQERARKDGEMKLKDIVKNGKWDDAMKILSSFGDRASLGDFFDNTIIENPDLQKKRAELSGLQMQSKIDPSEIKLTSDRVIGMTIHPAVDKRLIICGDKEGELGIWDVDQFKTETDKNGEEYNVPQIVSLKVHSRAIATVQINPHSPEKAYTGSYDGSVRVLDLTSTVSSESFIFDSNPRNPIGISDFHLPEPNLMYFSTLEGRFGIHDMREKPTSVVQLFRMHDKKLGGFSYNPNNIHQIASASLDRTLKVWDLRQNHPIEDTDEKEPGLYGEYGSRLSISTADWSKSGHVVCNGYDNTINIFDFTKSDTWKVPKEPQEYDPTVRIKHNCQTGKWVSILKAHWHRSPADGVAKFAIANMNRYIDVYAANGQQLAHLGHELMTAVPAVVRFHPTQNWLAGASASSKVYVWE